jgi:hypothetical protein
MPRSAEDIRAELRAPDFDSIEVWKVPAASSADPKVALLNARELAKQPLYGARFGGLEVLLSADEYVTLAKEQSSPNTRLFRFNQRVSFATGNVGIEYPAITIEYVAAVAGGRPR